MIMVFKAHAKWSFDEKQPNKNGKFVAKMVCILSTAYVKFTLNLEIPLAFLLSFHFLSTTIFGTSKGKQRWQWNSKEFSVLMLMQTHFNIQQSKGTVMWTFCLLEMTLIGRICVTCSCGIFAEFRVHFDSMLLPSIFINCRFFCLIWFTACNRLSSAGSQVRIVWYWGNERVIWGKGKFVYNWKKWHRCISGVFNSTPQIPPASCSLFDWT